MHCLWAQGPRGEGGDAKKMAAAARQSLRAPTRGSTGAEHTSAPSRRCSFLQEAAQKISEQLPLLAAELMSTAQFVARESNLPRRVFKVRRPSTFLFFSLAGFKCLFCPERNGRVALQTDSAFSLCRVFHVALRVNTPRREHTRRRRRATCANIYRGYVRRVFPPLSYCAQSTATCECLNCHVE